MTYTQFERRLLDLAFTSDLPLTPQTVAFALEIPISEAKTLLDQMVANDGLELEVDDDGQTRYQLPGRDEARRAHLALAPRPPAALVRFGTPHGLAVVALLLNTLLLPGLGTMIAGRHSTGAAQMALALVALPLCLVLVGVPLLVIAWGWGLATAVQMLHEHEAYRWRRNQL
jgi:hypothetical protein